MTGRLPYHPRLREERLAWALKPTVRKPVLIVRTVMVADVTA
jgi:hypothetical protein